MQPLLYVQVNIAMRLGFPTMLWRPVDARGKLTEGVKAARVPDRWSSLKGADMAELETLFSRLPISVWKGSSRLTSILSSNT